MISSISIILITICGLGFSASDYFRKLALNNLNARILLLVFVSGQIPLIGLWFILSNDYHIKIYYWPLGILASLMGLIANLLFLKSLKVSEISKVIPILGIIPVFTSLSSFLIMGETLNLYQVFGIALSCLALIIIYSPSGMSPFLGFKSFIHDKGALLMTAVAVIWSILAPIDKLCIQYSSSATHGLIQTVLIALALLIYISLNKQEASLPLNKISLRTAMLASVTAGIAYGAQLMAYEMTLVTFVELYKRIIGIIGSLIVGRFFLSEIITKKKLFGIIMIIIALPLVMIDF